MMDMMGIVHDGYVGCACGMHVGVMGCILSGLWVCVCACLVYMLGLWCICMCLHAGVVCVCMYGGVCGGGISVCMLWIFVYTHVSVGMFTFGDCWALA